MLLAHSHIHINCSKHYGGTITTAQLHNKMGGPNISASASLDKEASKELWHTQETEQWPIIILQLLT